MGVERERERERERDSIVFLVPFVCLWVLWCVAHLEGWTGRTRSFGGAVVGEIRFTFSSSLQEDQKLCFGYSTPSS